MIVPGHPVLRRTILSGLLAVLAGGAAVRTQTIQDILLRTSQYLGRYERELSGIVMNEQYRQEIRRSRGGLAQYRDLQSDVLMVWVQEEQGWLMFRDVYRVDGREVRDRQQRLEHLFTGSRETAMSRGREIMNESARLNIGDVERNLNLPTFALLFLYPANWGRVDFENAGEETVEDTPTWVLRFNEHARPSVIRTNGGDSFARGRFWIEPEIGRPIRTELIVGDQNSEVKATIVVTYRPVPSLGVWAPAQMTEDYERPRNRSADSIHGAATYSNFRRFQVKVDEEIKPPSGQDDAASTPPG